MGHGFRPPLEAKNWRTLVENQAKFHYTAKQTRLFCSTLKNRRENNPGFLICTDIAQNTSSKT
jgi:hypothetical protein